MSYGDAYVPPGHDTRMHNLTLLFFLHDIRSDIYKDSLLEDLAVRSAYRACCPPHPYVCALR